MGVIYLTVPFAAEGTAGIDGGWPADAAVLMLPFTVITVTSHIRLTMGRVIHVAAARHVIAMI